MQQIPSTGQLIAIREFYQSGATQSYSFRKEQLLRLKDAILKYEEQFYEAFQQDLRKSKEEAWVTELGFVLAELRKTLRELKRWMAPQKVATNFLNFPSSSRILREPLGVVLIVGPWNYPFQLVVAPLISAIAAGNCVVVKTGEAASATDRVLKEMLESTFPSNFLAYAQGEGAEIIPALMKTFDFDHVFFTGGLQAGKAIYQQAAEKLIPVTLELGGKSPAIIESDANIDVAARRIASTKFSNSGQMCVAVDYVLVHESKKDALIQALKKCIIQFYGDDPAQSYNYGRMISKKQFNRVVGYLSQGKIVHGGSYNEDDLYIEPTLLTGVKWDDAVMQDEIFGPVLPILSFSDGEGWLSQTHHHPNPLAAYIFTASKEKEKFWQQHLHFGGGCVNNASWHLTNPELPFGGRGNSGMGRYHGQFGFDTFSHLKSILKTPTWFDPAMKYPPMKGKLGLFKKFIR